MAYTALTVANPGESGAMVAMANADTSNGNKFANDGKTMLEIFNNGSTGSLTVTIATGGTKGGKALADDTHVLTTTQRKRVGPFRPDVYNVESGTDAGCVLVTVTGTGAADLDLEAFRCGG